MGSGESQNLLAMSPAAGCGCKLPLQQMRDFMTGLNALHLLRPHSAGVVLDGTDGDDAALYEIEPGRLLAVTTDFGTPVSADAYTWGRIAAENALSDVYAMGARPLLALSMLAVPDTFDVALMQRLTDGALATLSEAGAPLVGGHTVRSSVPFFGLSLVGEVPAGQPMLLRNAHPGDRLVLTKQLGVGVVLAAAKAEVIPPDLLQQAEAEMLRSNRAAAAVATRLGIAAATDVTGFGLIGHLQNMMDASGCSADLWASTVPVLAGVEELLEEHAVVPNSAENNMFVADEYVDWAGARFALRLILCDPQTSGGLLLAVDPSAEREFVDECAAAGVNAVVIGEVHQAREDSVVLCP